MSRKCVFFDVTRRLLDERLDMVKSGVKPAWTDLRHLFYQCRNVLLRENPDLDEVDSKAKNVYVIWQDCIKRWCEKQLGDSEIDAWWRVREKINIWAEGKAQCNGESGEFLVTPDKRSRVSQGCSFILLCEKRTVSRELLENLRSEGYKVNLVSTGGQSPSDVKEAVIEATEELNQSGIENFYILSLHDYDIDGAIIYLDVKKHFGNVLDVGVNGRFLDFIKDTQDLDLRLVEEQRVTKVDYENDYVDKDNTRDRVIGDENYTEADWGYLYGEPFEVMVRGNPTIHHRGKRIEIDAIHVEHGIQPFVDYIKQIILLRCKCWDLTRIGVTEYELVEPRNPFEEAVVSLESDISQATHDAWERISKPIEAVEAFVRGVTDHFRDEYRGVRAKYGIEGDYAHTLNREDFDELKEKYSSGFSRMYAPAFYGDLAYLNGRVHNYCGDVTKAKTALDGEHDALQEEVDGRAGNDGEAGEFEDELSELDWGEEEFEGLDAPDERDVIEQVIGALQERLGELEGGRR